MDQQFSDEQIEEFRQVFNLFDKDDKKYITTTDLASVMRALGQNPTEHDIKDIMNDLGKDSNGTIKFEEFLQLLARHYKNSEETRDELWKSFKMFDKNGDGTISKEELREAMIKFGERMTEEEVSEMLEAADVNGDGVIDYNEFCQMMLQ